MCATSANFECSCDHERNGPSIGQSDTFENQGRYDWYAECIVGMSLQGLWIVRLEYMPYPMTWQALGWLLARLTRPSSSGKRMRQRRQNHILSILGLQRTCAGSSATEGRLVSSWNTNFLSQILEAKLQSSGHWRSVLDNANTPHDWLSGILCTPWIISWDTQLSCRWLHLCQILANLRVDLRIWGDILVRAHEHGC